MAEIRYLRPDAAADYLRERYVHGAVRTLAKLRCIGGGPKFHKAGSVVVYDPTELDRWALAKLSKPLHSTSEMAVA